MLNTVCDHFTYKLQVASLLIYCWHFHWAMGIGIFLCLTTHIGCIAPVVGMAFSRVCLFVRALKGKRLELSPPKSVDT